MTPAALLRSPTMTARERHPPTMTGTRQKPAPPSRKKTPAALLSLLTSKPDTANDHTANDDTPPPVRIQTPANDDTRRPAEVANDDSERETPRRPFFFA